MAGEDELSFPERMEVATLEVGLLIRDVVEDAEAEGYPADAITAALLASAIGHRRRIRGAAAVTPWLMRALEASRSPLSVLGTVAQH